jgi:hypothetical protein
VDRHFFRLRGSPECTSNQTNHRIAAFTKDQIQAWINSETWRMKKKRKDVPAKKDIEQTRLIKQAKNN